MDAAAAGVQHFYDLCLSALGRSDQAVGEDQEVWFGVLFTGWFAKLGGLLHWLVYGAASYGYLKMKRWMHPWSVIYLLQIALGMLVWSLLDERGGGLATGSIVAGFFLLIAYFSWRERARFDG